MVPKVKGMENGQHTAQSQQPASEKILNTSVHHLLQDNIDLQCSTPWEREGFSKTDSTQYCNSKKHLNQEEAQLLATPPMHQIQPNGSIKDYLRNTNVNIKHKLKTSKQEASRRIKQEEAQKQKKTMLQ